MKILLTGGTGQVGFELQRSLSTLGEILAPDRQQLDLSVAAAVEDFLQRHNPGLIVNAAAYTAVDNAESEQEQAQRLNAGLPQQLAAYAKAHDSLLVHYSSDYVYSGSGTTPWTEESETGPLGMYGQTKLAGDKAIQASGCCHLIFRTSWVYSARGHNFMHTMLRLAQDKTGLSIVADQVGAPTPARLIADITAHALVRSGINSVRKLPVGARSAHESSVEHIPSGIYHLTPKGETSWHGFAEAILQLASEQGYSLAIQPGGVKPIPTSDYPTPAQRPLNSRLCTDKLERVLQLRLPHWRSQLDLTFKEILG